MSSSKAQNKSETEKSPEDNDSPLVKDESDDKALDNQSSTKKSKNKKKSEKPSSGNDENKKSKDPKKEDSKNKSKDNDKDDKTAKSKDNDKDAKAKSDPSKAKAENGNKASPNSKAIKSSKDALKQKEFEDKCKLLMKNFGSFKLLAVYKLMSKKTFCLTPTHFFLAKKDFKPNAKDAFVFPWNKMKKLDIGPKVINLSFNSLKKEGDAKEKLDFRMEFLKGEYDEGVMKLCDTIQRVLLMSELKQLNFAKAKAPPVQIGSLSAIYRFKMISSNVELLPETKDKMNDIITFSQPTVDIHEVQDATTFVPIFFDVLPMIKSVQTLKIPLLKELSIYELASKLMKETTTLRAIELTGNCKKMMSRFLTAIKETRESNVSGISFDLSHLKIEDLDLVADIVASGKIRSVGFHNAFRDEAVTYFYSSFLVPKVTDNLLSLSLDQTSNIELTKLFPKLRKVALLSLAGCDLNIVNVFHLLCLHSSSLTQLQMINLSGNTFSEKESDKSKFPPKMVRLPQNLKNFMLNYISWPDKAFRNFFEFVFDHVANKLKLSLTGSMTSTKEWKSVFEYLAESNYTGLSELVWDDNTVDPSLFHFLAQNTGIVKLQMNGCFDYQAKNQITPFIDYLNTASNLQALVIRGHNAQTIGYYLPQVLIALKGIPNLKLLDIGDTKIGEKRDENEDESETVTRDEQIDVGLRYLKELSESSRSLQFLNYDGMLPNDSDHYIDVLKYFAEVHDHLLVSFPSTDLKRLLEKNRIDQKEFDTIQELFYYQPTTLDSPLPSSDSKIAQWESSKLSKPVNLYKLYNQDEFPLFVNVKLATRLSKRARPLSLSLSDHDNDDLAWDPSQYISTTSFIPDDTLLDKIEMHSEPNKEFSSDDEEKDDDIKPKRQMKQRFGSVRLPRNKLQFNQQQKPQQPQNFLVDEEAKERSALVQNEDEIVHSESSSSSSSKSSENEEALQKEESPEENNEENAAAEESEAEDADKNSDDSDKVDENTEKEEEREAEVEDETNEDTKKEEEETEKQVDTKGYDLVDENQKTSSSSSSSEEEVEKQESSNVEEKQPEAHSSSSESSESSEVEEGKPKISPRGLPPLPPKKISPADVKLEEPDYDLPMLTDLEYPIPWKKLDKEITLEGIYDKISSEQRSKVIEQYQKKKK